VHTRGPDVVLEPATAQTLALALHELATNAAKYGPLSVPAGCVELSWEVRPGYLVLEWMETGGPPVEAPRTKGYGTRIIGASIERQLGGAAMFDWRREGLHCTLSVPRSETLKQSERRNGLVHSVPEPPVAPVVLAGNRMLLVEDEALVAMAMKDTLVALGFDVLGAFGTAADALAAAMEHDVDAAILDVNIGGELIYPVAEYLIVKGVPIVFVTGYGAETIDARFAKVPVLRKPIDGQLLHDAFVVGRRASAAARRADRARQRAPTSGP
jgi:CheY-like chemotaxis protein